MIQRLLTAQAMSSTPGPSKDALRHRENMRMLLRCGKAIDELRAEERDAHMPID